MFTIVAGILFPVFAITLVGFAIGRWIKIDFQPINRINMDFFVPALVFSSIGTMSLDITKIPLLGASILTTLIPFLLMFPICKLFKINFKVWALPNIFRNTGNLAIPLFTYAFGPQALAPAVLLFVVSACAHFSLGFAIVSKGNQLKKIIKIPTFIAAFLALSLNLSGITVWPPIYEAAALLGQTAVPIMLLSLGAQMCNMKLAGLKVGIACTLLSLATGAITFLTIYLFVPLSTLHLQMMLLFTMLPPAAMNYMIAERFNMEPTKVASMVLYGNFFSVITLPILLTITFSLAQ
ncbi:AEC family transporter [Marinomonas sp. C2222]|uniref:AEC family transporter n=1 Tax=Marinomonas sargassi TaxID=2984494 RepID=A0ABT2YV66_9GAMM|nr:AEC family transporter [Marinomonas sargassi]MCV2403758.1 AEC family transporter [Marinomonas sargassi]